MKSAVIVFPGSNCDRDMQTAITSVTGHAPTMVWHADTSLPDNLDFIALPGGFSYGDYLRCGAMSAKSPIMREVIKAADKGVYLLGVCNGFQVLTESGLLPGTLMRNRDLKFLCKNVTLKINNTESDFTKGYKNTSTISVPIAHHDGNYFAEESILNELEQNNQIAFTYCNDNGEADTNSNPNGSCNNIAGILNKNKRILGMMPHPERAAEKALGGEDGKALFTSLLSAFN